jgi:hypothetical protein
MITLFRLMSLFILSWLLIYILAMGLRYLLLQRLSSIWPQPQNDPPPTHSNEIDQALVSCHHCGLYIVKQHALQQPPHYFCCQAHKDSIK